MAEEAQKLLDALLKEVDHIYYDNRTLSFALNAEIRKNHYEKAQQIMGRLSAVLAK